MSGITEQITIQTQGAAQQLQLIREKWGISVYRCIYDGQRAVLKLFEHEGDRREIAHYRLLKSIHVPTIRVFELSDRYIIMEDIEASDLWRMGKEEDMKDPKVLRALAEWYFALHEGGEGHERLKEMWSENDELKLSSIELIREKLPGTEALCEFAEAKLEAIRTLLEARENTVAYNDFYYTNFIVRRDKSAALMFDYNLMGRGYRYADFRNIASSVSEEAFAAFEAEYGRLYREKYGREFAKNRNEMRLDDFLSPLLGLVSALRREEFPKWAEQMKEDALGGRLLALGKEIFEYAD